jgi:hypothetical protein
VIAEFVISSVHLSIAAEYSIALIQYEKVRMTPDLVQSFHTESIRWILLDQLLKHQNLYITSAYDKVLVVNVDSTAFQGDPFAPLNGKKGDTFIAYSLSSDATAIIDSGPTAKTIEACFGPQMLEVISPFAVLSPSTSLGTMDVVADYVEKMAKILLGQSVLGRNFPQCESSESAMGVHNVIVYADVLMHMSVKKTDSFPIVDVNSFPGFWAWSSNF